MRDKENITGWLESMQRQDLLVRWLIEDTGLDDAVIRGLLPLAYTQAAKQTGMWLFFGKTGTASSISHAGTPIQKT